MSCLWYWGGAVGHHELLLRLFAPGHVTLGSGVWLSTVFCVASQYLSPLLVLVCSEGELGVLG